MIAVLGATGAVGLSLARKLSYDPRGLTLFARHPKRLAAEVFPSSVPLRPLDDFTAAKFDVVINAIGAGDPARVAAMGSEIIEVTATWDRRILETMAPDTRYVFLSSGAVYAASDDVRGAIASAPAPGNGPNALPPYVLAKLEAELRHRRLPERSILDLRVFAFADITLPLGGRFFLSELARSIILQTVFKTTPEDMIRDYAGGSEMVDLIACWEANGARNGAFDLYTKAPARKRDILDLASSRFGVSIEYRTDIGESPTGAKPAYASGNRAAKTLGYAPQRTALQVVADYFDQVTRLGSAPSIGS